jgi:hypothetical protein
MRRWETCGLDLEAWHRDLRGKPAAIAGVDGEGLEQLQLRRRDAAGPGIMRRLSARRCAALVAPSLLLGAAAHGQSEEEEMAQVYGDPGWRSSSAAAAAAAAA